MLLAYDCNTGLLIYLWPTCCYGVMTDYRKFHNKMIAYATKDDPINIRVDTLKDLDSPDESLFAISQPTPPSKRVVTENLTETEVRMSAPAKNVAILAGLGRSQGSSRESPVGGDAVRTLHQFLNRFSAAGLLITHRLILLGGSSHDL